LRFGAPSWKSLTSLANSAMRRATGWMVAVE
jgi:hypothetical protein